MAEANFTLSSNAERLLTYAGDYSNFYKGTESQLVEAGIVKSEWLPSLHGNARTSTRVGLVEGQMRLLPFGVMATRFQEENGLIHIFRAGKSTFRVQVRKTQEEIERRQEEEQRETLRKEIEKYSKDKAKKIAELPADHKAYLRRELHMIKSMMSTIRTSLTSGFGYTGGYSFSPSLVVEFDILSDHLIQMVKEERIYFNQEKRQQEIAKIEDEFMAEHPQFSSFMKATLAIGKAALIG